MNDSTNSALLKVENIRREYPTPGDPLVILDGVGLEVDRGQSVAIAHPASVTMGREESDTADSMISSNAST